ncbi:hypothetical protein [Flammeovirga sp. SubArs3]|uniref:hypothetical protein n=1 Tax=Flammeovirga sp. SubArs3 TaxID=2995316 RepID=UPI00248BF3E8|nr:hypothetical protein [Flammeovirga sp. SubArs3]
MDFITYANNWAKAEVTQGKVMIGIGFLIFAVLVMILKSDNQLLKGSSIPLGLLITILIGYGGYIIYSRPAHVEKSVQLYNESNQEGIKAEITKHTNDNKAGKTLIKYVYPGLMLLSIIGLVLSQTPYYKGVALGIIILSVATYIMDSGFVKRSDDFLIFLEQL